MEFKRISSNKWNAHIEHNGFLLIAPTDDRENVNIVNFNYMSSQFSIQAPILVYFEGDKEPFTFYPNTSGFCNVDIKNYGNKPIRRIYVKKVPLLDYTLDYTLKAI